MTRNISHLFMILSVGFLPVTWPVKAGGPGKSAIYQTREISRIRHAPLQSDPTEQTRSRFVMGTLLEVTVVGHNILHTSKLLDMAFEEAERQNDILSDWNDSSELMRFAARAGTGWIVVSSNLARALKDSLALGIETGGAFDVTVGPLTHAKRHNSDHPVNIAPIVGLEHLHVLGAHARLDRPGMILDLGGIGKGFAADRIRARLESAGALAGFINFGTSTLLGFGNREWPILVVDFFGRPWTIWILVNAAMSTSEASAAKDDIINPNPKRPVTTPSRVTALGWSATRVEGWTTAGIVLGRAGLEKMKRPPDLLMIHEDSAGLTRWTGPAAPDPRQTRIQVLQDGS